MSDLLENEAFISGVVVGIGLYQQKVVMAHKRKEHLKDNRKSCECIRQYICSNKKTNQFRRWR